MIMFHVVGFIQGNSLIEGTVEYPLFIMMLSFHNLDSKKILELNGYDPSVDILHAVLFGVAKYSVNHLVEVTLVKNQGKMNRLVRSLKCYETCKDYSRSFSKQMKHCRSFLGRDYKQLLQILTHMILEEPTNAVTY